MSSPDNCVILCDQCHEDIGHNNNYGKGAVALPSAFNHSHQAEEYKYSHWRVKKEHQLWSDKINKIWEELIPMKSS